jgi:ferredoxin-NADP reductase
MISILRTAVDDRDPRQFVLIYGNRDRDGITFREELQLLTRQLQLRVFHVLTRPDPSWTGLKGRITSTVLQQTLPVDLRRWDFFLCGSPPAIDSSLLALQALGVPPERVHAERFVAI